MLAGVRTSGFRQIPGELGGSSRNSVSSEDACDYTEVGALLMIFRELNACFIALECGLIRFRLGRVQESGYSGHHAHGHASMAGYADQRIYTI